MAWTIDYKIKSDVSLNELFWTACHSSQSVSSYSIYPTTKFYLRICELYIHSHTYKNIMHSHTNGWMPSWGKSEQSSKTSKRWDLIKNGILKIGSKSITSCFEKLLIFKVGSWKIVKAWKVSLLKAEVHRNNVPFYF